MNQAGTDCELTRPPQVLVFDSGVGGLSVARCIHARLPSVRLTHLADNAGFPYGNRSAQTVIERTVNLVRAQLARRPFDVVVVACNTASTVALPALRAAVDQPVVGVVPAVKPAAALSVNRRIGLLATPATVNRPYLAGLIEEFASDCRIERVGHPELVSWIEDWARGRDLPEESLSLALEPFRRARVDTVVLGCTHYPLIGEVLKRMLPQVMHWVDSGEAIARRTAYLLSEAGFAPGQLAGTPAPEHQCFFSGPVTGPIDDFLRVRGFQRDSIAP